MSLMSDSIARVCALLVDDRRLMIRQLEWLMAREKCNSILDNNILFGYIIAASLSGQDLKIYRSFEITYRYIDCITYSSVWEQWNVFVWTDGETRENIDISLRYL